MDSNLLIAILSLAGTIIGSLIGAISSSKLINFRLTTLEEKVDKYNSLFERLSIAELKIQTIDNYVKDNCE